MVMRIKEIISFFEDRKKDVEEQIRILKENINSLRNIKESHIVEMKKLQKEFFLKLKAEKRAGVNCDFRQGLDFHRARIQEIKLMEKKIESEITELKRDLSSILQRLRALEKIELRLEEKEKASRRKKEEREINDLFMVKYGGR